MLPIVQWLAVAVSLNAVASLYVKYSNTLAHLGLLNNWVPTAYARTLLYAITCLGISFICFTLAARTLPISLVYSVHVGMSLLILTLITWYFMGETLETIQYFGILLLILAVALITAPDIRTGPNTLSETSETTQ